MNALPKTSRKMLFPLQTTARHRRARKGSVMGLMAVLLPVLAILAAFASFSGLVTDPVQSLTGLHRYRLNKLIDSLEQDYRDATRSSFSPKSPYLARVLELLDAAKLHMV